MKILNNPQKYRLVFESLISEAFIAVGQVDDAAIGEAVLLDVVLHDTIILMGIDADVGIVREAKVDDVAIVAFQWR